MPDKVSINVVIKNGPLAGQSVPIDVEVGVRAGDIGFTAAGGSTVAIALITAAVAESPVPLIGAALGLGILGAKIVTAVGDANTMTVTLINAVPNSTLSISEFNPTEGRLIDPTEQELLYEKAITDSSSAMALQLYSQPFRSAGIQQGSLNARIVFEDGTPAELEFSWYNPLSRDSAISSATYSVTPGLNGSLIDWKKDVSHPPLNNLPLENYRADAVTIIIFPTAEGCKHIH